MSDLTGNVGGVCASSVIAGIAIGVAVVAIVAWAPAHAALILLIVGIVTAR